MTTRRSARPARRNAVAVFLLLVAWTAGAAGAPSATAQPAQRAAGADPAARPWTFLIYGAADNNADGPILQFLDQLRKALDDDPGMEMLLFIDRSTRYSNDARILGQNFSAARLYRLRSNSAERLAGGEQFPELTLDQDTELDSADPVNLRKFIAWGKRVAPARRYGLLIYSHADGQTMCPDEHTRTHMAIPALSEVLTADESVDFLALELCNMSGIEIAYQWRPAAGRFGADVLLAIPNAGPPLDWDRAFARIRSPGRDSSAGRPPLEPGEMTAADFGRLVIEEGRRGRLESNRPGGDGEREAAACLDLRQAERVRQSLDALSRTLAGADAQSASQAREVFLRLRGPESRSPTATAAINYSGGGPFVDVYDLCKRAAACAELSPAARAAAAAASESVDECVIASFGMSGYAGFEAGRSGVFVVLPAAGSDWKKLAWYTPLPGVGATHGRWAFLRDGATPDNGQVENWFELLDYWFDASDAQGGANGYRP